jgi:hypothetical protein
LIAGLDGAADSEFAVVFFDGSVQAQTLSPNFRTAASATLFVDLFLYTGGGTNIPLGVDACVAKGSSAQHLEKFLITVTDGVGGDVTASTAAAEADGWTLVAVGVGGGTGATTMNLLSGGNPDLLFEVDDGGALNDIIDEIEDQVNCS